MFVISEQPQEHGHRFRYPTEKRDGGNLLGEKSGMFGRKSFPELELSDDIEKSDRHFVLVSCVEAEPIDSDEHGNPKYRIHPCSITGRHVKNGICKIFFNKKHSVVTLDHLGIQMASKKSIDASIAKKIKLGLDFYDAGQSSAPFDMKKLRLSFQVHVWQKSLKKYVISEPQVSNIIMDQRCYDPLTIQVISSTQATFDGNKEIMMFTSKINKTEINIGFENEQGQRLHFHLEKMDFYGQNGLTFRTPKIFQNEEAKILKTKLFLWRQSKDGTIEESNKIEFVFNENDAEQEIQHFETTKVSRSRQSSGYNSDVENMPEQLAEKVVNKRQHESQSFISARGIQNPTKKVAPTEDPLESLEPSFTQLTNDADALQYVMTQAGIFQEQDMNLQPSSEFQAEIQGKPNFIEAPSSGLDLPEIEDLSMLLDLID